MLAKRRGKRSARQKTRRSARQKAKGTAKQKTKGADKKKDRQVRHKKMGKEVLGFLVSVFAGANMNLATGHNALFGMNHFIAILSRMCEIGCAAESAADDLISEVAEVDDDKKNQYLEMYWITLGSLCANFTLAYLTILWHIPAARYHWVACSQYHYNRTPMQQAARFAKF